MGLCGGRFQVRLGPLQPPGLIESRLRNAGTNVDQLERFSLSHVDADMLMGASRM